MTEFNLCGTPAGYSSRNYTGYAGEHIGDEPYGYHNLETGNCQIDHQWVRASDGAPTYARIDFTRVSQISDPDLSIRWKGDQVKDGNFSWGTGRIGLGSPGSGDGYLAAPRIEVEITGDQDVTPTAVPHFRGVFLNAAGSVFATDWISFRFESSTTFFNTTYTTDFHVYVDGSTGHIEMSDDSGSADVSDSVALSGSFLGDYDRWESWHDGGGGGSSNEGGISEGDQHCDGRILTVDVAGIQLIRPMVGAVGFG